MTTSRGGILAIGAALVVVAGANAAVAAAILRPWFDAGASANGEAWFLVVGSLDLAVAALGASLVRAGLGRPRLPLPALVRGPRLYEGMSAEDEQAVRRQDSLLQDMVAARLAIELDQPQAALDALSPAISHLSRSVTQAVAGDVPHGPSAPL